jgi:hypothetical protein
MQSDWQCSPQVEPLPWLMEENNPSARYLALRDLLDCADYDSQASEARAAIPAWPPVREILSVMDPVDFWGRADRPFYGGAVSTHAMLHLLAELGLPPSPPLEAACENLLQHGQHASGGFSYDGTPERIFLCYTGDAIRTLLHFGYRGDPRLEHALAYLVTRCTTAEGLTCAYADGEQCQWGIAKALGAFAALSALDRTAERMEAIAILTNAVLDHTFDFEGRDSRWLDFGFPLNYQSDLTELCDVLARLDYGPDPRFQKLLEIVQAAQTADRRWVKRYGTRALQVEEQGQPSKWVTLRALRAIKYAERGVTKALQAEFRGEIDR